MGVLTWTAVAVLTFIFLFWRFEVSQVYRPGRKLRATGAELGRTFEDVHFRAADGVNLHGWFFPAEATSARKDRVFLVCHWNEGNIGHQLRLCRVLLRTGAAVFVFDYRGYGCSRGDPMEEGTYLDAQAAHQWLRSKGFAEEGIIVFGESLGGAIATELAVREKASGLILQSTFTNVPDIGVLRFPWLPVRVLGRIRYNTLAKLPRITTPILVMHSRTDEVVPFRQAEANFAAANEPKFFCELPCRHYDPACEESVFQKAVDAFLKVVENNGQAARPAPSPVPQSAA